MIDKLAHRPEVGARVRLNQYDPDHTGDLDKSAARKRTDHNRQRIAELQRVLFADSRHALLIVLQGMDASGKNSTIQRVLEGVNPLGVQVASFAEPTHEELAHDFLWRVHARVPARGMIGVFNRSHYEDVLIVRVESLVRPEEWRKRYEHINNFERLLVDSGVTILKFFLHISKDEQKKQFLERLESPEKHWKFSMGDLAVRKRWDDYMVAYEDAISLCNTPWAPWHIIPANRRWYRDAVISEYVADALEAMDLAYPPPSEDLSRVVILD